MARRIALAGFAYFLAVFAAGFVIGAVRVLLVAPRTGELAAVALELPVMLAIAWLAAGAILRRLLPGAGPAARLATGGLALALLIPAEVALGMLGFGRSLGEVLEGWARPAGLLGLAGQAAFALIPWARGRADPGPDPGPGTGAGGGHGPRRG